MRAHVKTDDCEYTLDNVEAIHFQCGAIVIIYKVNGGIATTSFTDDSLDGGSVTIQ